jgi:probable HAF family extracellular repeat protein
MRRSAMVLGVVSLLFACAPVASAIVVQGISPLGIYTLYGVTNSTVGMGVNASGQVVGYGGWASVYQNPWVSHGWYYDTAGPLVDIGNMQGGPFKNEADYLARGATDNLICQVNAINSAGVAVGLAGNGTATHAFSYTLSGGFTDLGALAGGTTVSRAYAINDSGVIAGTSQFSGGGNNDYHVFRYAGGTMTELGTLISGSGAGVTAHATGINASGQIVGYSNYSGGTATQYHAFLCTGTTFQDLGTLGGASSWAKDVNDSGTVVGYAADSAGASHAYYWTSAGGMVDLGFLSGGSASRAHGITNSGIIVGDSTVGGTNRAMVWTATGGLVDLYNLLPSGSGWDSLTAAYGISENGWVTGTGVYGGVQEAFRLKLAAGFPGDANGDGTVNIQDLSKVLTNYDKTGMGWGDGDFNGDGTVNITDLSNVLTNYDKTAGVSVAGIQAVPEPSALALLAAGWLGLTAYVWRKRP